MHPRVVRILGVVLLIFLDACGGDNDNPMAPGDVRNNNFVASEPFQFNLSGAGRATLRLEGINGSVVITGGPASSGVAISGEREVRSDSLQDAQTQLQQLRVDVQDQGTNILVRTGQPQDTGGRNYTVNYRVVLPGSIGLTVTNVNGSLEVTGMTGGVSANLVNGPIDSTLEVPPGGSVELTTVNGEIVLRLPQSTSAMFSAQVVNGTISLTGLSLKNEVRTSTSLRGTLGAGNGTVSLQTTNGGIRVDGTS